MLIGTYFFALAGPGLTSKLNADDVHNLHRYWDAGPWQVGKANLLFYSSFYRPAGALFYLPLFSLFDFVPLPYRIVSFAILLVNLWLFYVFARQLTKNRVTAALSVLLGSFHAAMIAIYYSSATLYDTLCFFFYFAALVYYIGIRQNGRLPRLFELFVFLLLYACALNSKEMAVSLPLAVLGYEWIFAPAPSANAADIARWFTRQGRTAIAAGVVTLIYIIGKSVGLDSLLAVDAYQPQFSIHRFMTTWRAYTGMLFYSRLNTFMTMGIWTALIGLAWLTKSAVRKWAVLFSLLSMLPVDFLPVREGFVLYIPLVGLAIYLATLLTTARLPQWALFLGVALLLGFVHYKEQAKVAPNLLWATNQGAWKAIDQLRALHPKSPPPGGAVIIFDDPFPGSFQMLFITRLYFHDRTLQVDLARYGRSRQHYDLELAFDGGRLVQR